MGLATLSARKNDWNDFDDFGGFGGFGGGREDGGGEGGFFDEPYLTMNKYNVIRRSVMGFSA